MDSIRYEPATAHAVVVDVNTRRFGLPLDLIVEVIRVEDGTYTGFISRRGVNIPVVDLRQIFGEPEREGGAQSRILVLRTPEGHFGLAVDGITSVISSASLMPIGQTPPWEWLEPHLVIPHREV